MIREPQTKRCIHPTHACVACRSLAALGVEWEDRAGRLFGDRERLQD